MIPHGFPREPSARCSICIVIALLLTACTDGRRTGGDASSPSGEFSSTVLSKDRAASDVSVEEALTFCREGVAYANAGLSVDEWEHVSCLNNAGLRESDEAACMAAVEECEASDALREGYDFASVTGRCGFDWRQSDCTVSLSELEDCWDQYRASFPAIYGARTCALAGMTVPDFTPSFSPGCQAAFEGGCGCLLGASAGTTYCR